MHDRDARSCGGKAGVMDLGYYGQQLGAAAALIAGMLQDMPEEQARWRPMPEAWSALEVINHLYDEEREDFRLRLELTLNQPEQPVPPIDPQGWVMARQYNQRDLNESLNRFLAERAASLDWLATLDAPEWSRTVNHPHLGDVRAGDLLAAWAAHDSLHLRQLIELRYLYLAAHAAPYSVEYAGDW